MHAARSDIIESFGRSFKAELGNIGSHAIAIYSNSKISVMP